MPTPPNPRQPLLLSAPVPNPPTRRIVRTLPLGEVVDGDLDEPVRCRGAAVERDGLRADLIAPQPGEDVDPGDVVDGAEDDAAGGLVRQRSFLLWK